MDGREDRRAPGAGGAARATLVEETVESNREENKHASAAAEEGATEDGFQTNVNLSTDRGASGRLRWRRNLEKKYGKDNSEEKRAVAAATIARLEAMRTNKREEANTAEPAAEVGWDGAADEHGQEPPRLSDMEPELTKKFQSLNDARGNYFELPRIGERQPDLKKFKLERTLHHLGLGKGNTEQYKTNDARDRGSVVTPSAGTREKTNEKKRISSTDYLTKEFVNDAGLLGRGYTAPADVFNGKLRTKDKGPDEVFVPVPSYQYENAKDDYDLATGGDIMRDDSSEETAAVSSGRDDEATAAATTGEAGTRDDEASLVSDDNSPPGGDAEPDLHLTPSIEVEASSHVDEPSAHEQEPSPDAEPALPADEPPLDLEAGEAMPFPPSEDPELRKESSLAAEPDLPADEPGVHPAPLAEGEPPLYAYEPMVHDEPAVDAEPSLLEALRRQRDEANAKLALAKFPEVVDLTEDGPESTTDATGKGPNQNDVSTSPDQPKSALACMQIKQEAKEAAEERASLAEERMLAAEKEVEALRKAADDNAVVRHGQKESLLSNLESHNAELRPSSIHGIGVFALALIPVGTKLFQFNGGPSSRTCGLAADEIGSLPNHVQHILQKFILYNEEDGLYHVPEHGLSCALGVSYYLNSAEGAKHEPNVEFGRDLDSSGLAEIVATRDIGKDEELLLSYQVNGTKTRRRQRRRRVFGQNTLAMADKAASNKATANGCTAKPRKTLHVCGECEACVRDDCGKCQHCLDKPKFGGKGTRRQKCLLRKCLVVKKKDMEKAQAVRDGLAAQPDTGSAALGDDSPDSVAGTTQQASDDEFSESSDDVPLFAWDASQTETLSGGRPKRKLKAIARFESMTFDKKAAHTKIGEGFSCPGCTATCSYDAKKCSHCQLSCYYEAGIGVVVLKERKVDQSQQHLAPQRRNTESAQLSATAHHDEASVVSDDSVLDNEPSPRKKMKIASKQVDNVPKQSSNKCGIRRRRRNPQQ
ncbi:hypothetical protein ACHAXT_003676 [Thalassiosira profunda]